jgi:hypothetical protein
MSSVGPEGFAVKIKDALSFVKFLGDGMKSGEKQLSWEDGKLVFAPRTDVLDPAKSKAVADVVLPLLQTVLNLKDLDIDVLFGVFSIQEDISQKHLVLDESHKKMLEKLSRKSKELLNKKDKAAVSVFEKFLKPSAPKPDSVLREWEESREGPEGLLSRIAKMTPEQVQNFSVEGIHLR